MADPLCEYESDCCSALKVFEEDNDSDHDHQLVRFVKGYAASPNSGLILLLMKMCKSPYFIRHSA